MEERAGEVSPHLSLALKYLRIVQDIDVQLPDGAAANLDLFIKLFAEVRHFTNEVLLYSNVEVHIF